MTNSVIAADLFFLTVAHIYVRFSAFLLFKNCIFNTQCIRLHDGQTAWLILSNHELIVYAS